MSAAGNLIDQHPPSICLVADIGGTHARFAIAGVSGNATDNPDVVLAHPQTYQVLEFESLGAALLDYLGRIPPSHRPSHAVLAVASAVTNDKVEFTNSRWSFSISALETQLKFERLEVINDFAAVAWALPSLKDNELETVGAIQPFSAQKPGVYATLGPGTGLGVAALKIENQVCTVLETEGGHISFAPRNDDEIKILKFLQKDYQRVSYERLLCGSGLLNLYRARCDLMQRPVTLSTPEAVSSAARQGDWAANAAAMDFCSILGAFAGDTALMFGAWQGVYLSGGLLPHLMDEKGNTLFREAFEDKGRFSSLLMKTPTCIIKRSDIGKLGAASLWFAHRK
jgi:glucokinase